MKSMTGYGKGVSLRDNRELVVELKSVNHRFLDISTKMSRMFLFAEDIVRNMISQQVTRGHIDIYVNYRLLGTTDKVVTADLALAKGYVEAASKLSNEFPQLHDDFALTALMRCGDVLSVEQAVEDESVLRGMMQEALTQALGQLNVMRGEEGNTLREDLLKKLDVMQQLLLKIKEFAPAVVENYREKLRQRVESALQGVEIDEAKLANEVCFFADKCCIDEETTRLATHILHAKEILSTEQPVGKKLDFLVQEFNREVNTICSKSNSTDLTNIALDMKNEVEKMREQVQNLE